MTAFGAAAFLKCVVAATRASSVQTFITLAALCGCTGTALAQRTTTRIPATPPAPATPATPAATTAALKAVADSARVRQDSLSARLRRAEEALGMRQDSATARLRRAEEAIALLQQQLGEATSSGVSTRSRMQLEMNGRVLVHTFRNDGRVNNVDDPQFVRPDSVSALPASNLGMAIRQTSLGIVLTSRDVLGGSFVGDLDADFYGGQQPSSGGRTFPLLRIRTARGAVRWSNGEVMVGQDSPLIAALNPVSPAALGTPAFVTAGNLWLWLPQARVTVKTGGSVSVGLQAAVLASTTGDAVGLFDTDADPAERSGRPATEARLRLQWGEEGRVSEIGCGGHLAWIAMPVDFAQSDAVACDAHINLGPIELRGEGYSGHALRGLGGGGISQNLNIASKPLMDVGGWGQISVEVSPPFRFGGGCGADRPDADSLAATARLYNRSCSGYTIVRPGGPIFIGAEYRRIETRYSSGTWANNHINFAIGFEF
ncbi:hypothetical protein BH09GEM1_BH09GEM1_10140 [soil metagenome]